MRCSFRVLATFAISLAAGVSLAAEAGPSREETLTLQQRLTDAGCYKGPVDGAPNAALDAAVKACPDQRPVLRIETGMHTLTIRGIGVDAACDLAVTGSHDKTARVWSLPDGRLQRTIRPPIDDKNGGEIYAVAMSRDGRTAAISGRDTLGESHGNNYAVYLFDPLVGGALRRIGSFGAPVFRLAFSPDGRQLATGQGAGGANEGNKLRVFDVALGRQLIGDPDYFFGVSAVTFGPDGDLYAMGEDSELRHYSRALQRTAKVKVDGPALESSDLGIDPTGRRIAIAYQSSPIINLLDARTLEIVGKADTDGIPGSDLSKLAWTGDGRLIAGGNGSILRTFDAQGRRMGGDKRVSRLAIESVQSCGAGVAFSTNDPSFGVVGGDGHVSTYAQVHVPNMIDKDGAGFAVSDDGQRIAFGLGAGAEQPVLFDLAAGSVSESGTNAPGLHRADTTGLPLQGTGAFDTPKLNGKTLLSEHDRLESFAARPDHNGLVMRTVFSGLYSFDANGNERWSRFGHGSLSGVNLARGGDLVVVAYFDGTIRWHRWSDGAELLTLFVDVPTKRFVAWTPTGYYMASPGGEDLIGWHMNRGWAQQADFFPASRFSARFNRSDIVQRVLKTLDEAEAVEQADGAAKRKTVVTPIEAQLPPVTTIVSPAPGARFSGDSVEVTFTVRSPSGLPIDGVQALIDGRPVEARGFVVSDKPAVAPAVGARRLTIPAPAGDFELALIARSGALVGEAARVRLAYAGAPPSDPADALKPKLYAVAIGVGDYADESLRLTYPAADARGFADALQKQKGGLYSDVEVRTILDKDATRANVLDALDWLDTVVTSRDIGMVLIAGHGLTDEKGHYWFLPSDAAPKRLVATAVSQEDIRREMSAIAGKAVLFLDTCHANRAIAARGLGPAGVDVASLVNDFSRTENGLITFAASQGAELSQESPAWGHGAFSLALIEGIGEGKADIEHRGTITVSGLDYYIVNRVKDLTEGHQHPVMSRPDTVPDFAFATAR
jgi:hypothetical protein